MTAPVVELRGVSCQLGTTPARPIVRDVSFTVAPGETLVLLGRSGSGKTATLKLINRLIEPSAGDVVVAGRSTAAVPPFRLRRGIGLGSKVSRRARDAVFVGTAMDYERPVEIPVRRR